MKREAIHGDVSLQYKSSDFIIEMSVRQKKKILKKCKLDFGLVTFSAHTCNHSLNLPSEAAWGLVSLGPAARGQELQPPQFTSQGWWWLWKMKAPPMPGGLTALKTSNMVPVLCAFKLLSFKPPCRCVGGNLDRVMCAVWMSWAVIFHRQIRQRQLRKD